MDDAARTGVEWVPRFIWVLLLSPYPDTARFAKGHAADFHHRDVAVNLPTGLRQSAPSGDSVNLFLYGGYRILG